MNTKIGSPCDFKSDLPEEDEKSPKEDKNIKYNRQNSPLYKQAAFILDQVRGKVKKNTTNNYKPNPFRNTKILDYIMEYYIPTPCLRSVRNTIPI